MATRYHANNGFDNATATTASIISIVAPVRLRARQLQISACLLSGYGACRIQVTGGAAFTGTSGNSPTPVLADLLLGGTQTTAVGQPVTHANIIIPLNDDIAPGQSISVYHENLGGTYDGSVSVVIVGS